MHVQLTRILFGLEARDFKVYQALLTHAEGISVRSLAKKAHMGRASSNAVVKNLVEQGIVTSHYKKRRKYYMARRPAFLRKYADERHELMNQAIANVQAYVSELEKSEEADVSNRFSQLYQGYDEINLLLHDVLDTVVGLPEKTYRVISSAEVSGHLYKQFKDFTGQRIKRGVAAQIITIGRTGRRAHLTQTKRLRAEQAPASYSIIYGTKTAQISVSQNGTLHGSVIDNASVAQMQALMFDKLWQTL